MVAFKLISWSCLVATLAWFSYRELQGDMFSILRVEVAFQGATTTYLEYPPACLQFKRRHVDFFKRSGYSRAVAIYYGNHCATFNIELIALHGDVSSNPGPLARNDTTDGNFTISNKSSSHHTFPTKCQTSSSPT